MRRFHMAAWVVLALAGLPLTANAQWTWTPQTGRLVNLDRLPKETPELQVEHARSLYLDGRYKEALGETEKFMEFYSDSDFADDNQFLRGEIRLAQGKQRDAADEFQQVVVLYPDSDRYDEVIEKQYEIGDYFYTRGLEKLEEPWWTLFRERPIRRAIEVYSMVIDNQPFTTAAAEAQYKVGLCRQSLEEYIAAAYEYQRVIEDYSTSEWVDDASYSLAMCYFEASLPPEYNQAPSQLAINAVNDFEVDYPADPRLDELENIRLEMRDKIAEQRLNTAKFYEKRRRFESARIYYQVVVEQYPDTPAADEARTWLSTREAGAPVVPVPDAEMES